MKIPASALVLPLCTFNPALDKDPLEPNKAHQHEAQRQQAAARENKNRPFSLFRFPSSR
jgi:hypothetical protein